MELELALAGDDAEAVERFARIGVLPVEAQVRLFAAEAFASGGRPDDAKGQLAGPEL